MPLVPVDQQIDDLLGKAARARGKGKGEILNLVLKEATAGSPASLDPTQVAKAVSVMPAARSGSIAEEINEMVRSMVQVKMLQLMGGTQGAPANSGMEDMKTLFLMKELTKPSFTELMMMQNFQSGKKTEEVPEYIKKYMDDQKETREMMKELIGLKRTSDQMKEMVAPLVEQMTQDREAYNANQQQILAYIAKGEGAAPNTLEGYIANALKERLTEQALDAIDQGLFKRREVVTPEGKFDWKEILDRMLGIGEKIVEKMPGRGIPAVMPVKRLDGTWVNPANNKVLTEQQAAIMIRNAQIQAQAMQPPAQAQETQPPSQEAVAAELVAPEETAATKEAKETVKKKKTAEAISTFTGDFETETKGAEGGSPKATKNTKKLNRVGTIN